MNRSRATGMNENSASRAEDFLNDSIEKLNPIKPIYTDPHEMYGDTSTLPPPSYLDKQYNYT